MERLPGIAPGHSPWRRDILLLNHSREIQGRGALWLRARMTTKNKHHHRPACAGLWPQVFRGGPFGVWGTPPPKPLNCKVWEMLDDALAIHACRSGFGLSTSKICR